MADPFLDDPGPTLSRRQPTGAEPRGVLLMLHGGTQQSLAPVTGGSASLRRMMLLRDALAPEVLAAGHALWLLKFAVRGWNGATGPVPDARWALEQVRTAYDDVPVVLLGHSMGGRSAAYVADDPSVVGVVGLAPWFEAGDPHRTFTGKSLVAGHGRRDRITSSRMTEQYVERAARVATSAQFHPLGPAGHYMLYRHGMWRRFALRHSLDLLDRAGRAGR